MFILRHNVYFNILAYIYFNYNVYGWDKPDPLIIDKFIYAKVSKGYLRGFSTNVPQHNKSAYVFKKIPFAEPPIKKLRFAPLKPLQKNWYGCLDATKYGPACVSNSTHTSSPQKYVSEDCLHANIFTSPTCFNGFKKCAVLIYIHGGNFLYDSAVMFNDQQIIEKYASDDVIFVTIAYRLGAFGFLDLGSDEIVQRNLGLYDIVFGLQWIRNEISNFGGDLNRITVMGNSGGANAIEFIMESRSICNDSRKIFNQAVFSSPAPTFKNNVNMAESKALIQRVGCAFSVKNKFGNSTSSTQNIKKQVDCLRNVDAIKFVSAQAANEALGFVFEGVGTSPDFPSKNFIGLLKHIKPSRILMSTVVEEFSSKNNDIEKECHKNAYNFNYDSQAFLDACYKRYSAKDRKKPPFISGESINSMAHLYGAANRKQGGQTFRASFRLENHTTHASDLLFFFGLHWKKNYTYTPAEKLMNLFYPQMIKNFVNIGVPALGWKPTNINDAGFYILDFKVKNGRIEKFPHFSQHYDNPNGLKFWIYDGYKIEKMSHLIDINSNISYVSSLQKQKSYKTKYDKGRNKQS